MILIIVTGVVTGRKALIYQKVGRQGRRAYVDTYHATAVCHSTGKTHLFGVVRDSSAVFFGEVDDTAGEQGECPASVEPYHGFIREDGPVGFRIQLHERTCEEKKKLIGSGPVSRKFIQIHFGAAASHGCIMVAGSRRDYRRVFERWMREALEHTQDIRVIVEPR